MPRTRSSSRLQVALRACAGSAANAAAFARGPPYPRSGLLARLLEGREIGLDRQATAGDRRRKSRFVKAAPRPADGSQQHRADEAVVTLGTVASISNTMTRSPCWRAINQFSGVRRALPERDSFRRSRRSDASRR